MRRRVTYRPSKAASMGGMIMGGIFVLIGLTVVIPMAGPFGILWTVMALVITVVNGAQAFGKKYFGPEIHVEDEEGFDRDTFPPDDRDPKTRLEQLEKLRTSGLISDREYEEKRQEILRQL